MPELPAEDRFLTPREVAAIFRVHPKTVTRWAMAGRLTSIRTPGNHRRFRLAEIRALLAADPGDICLACRYPFRSVGHRTSCGRAARA